jgi:hypothetical protein
MKKKKKKKQISAKSDPIIVHALPKEEENVEMNPMIQRNHDSNH